MKISIEKSSVGGRVRIPGSKSHTIRALFIASLAEGLSLIRDPLISRDTESAMLVCRSFGAGIRKEASVLKVEGFGSYPRIPDDVINVGNSGTTLRFALSTAALAEGYTVFTGDSQIRQRPVSDLSEALNSLGAQVISTRENGKAPLIVQGPVKGGKTDLKAVTSQYLSSLLINAPLFKEDTKIRVLELNEKPYVDLTLSWLDSQGIRYKNHDYKEWFIPGKQKYHSFDRAIPADFSSASFFLVLGALSDKEVILEGLDLKDPQGDKRVISILEEMGAVIKRQNGLVSVRGGKLKGVKADINDIPDALPVLAVAACFAEGTTELYNVPQARLKETDRISVMAEELTRMGARIEEKPDGLKIQGGLLTGTFVNGHHDHRVVMALTVAGLFACGKTVVDTAEAVEITFPDFYELIRQCGGKPDLKE